MKKAIHPNVFKKVIVLGTLLVLAGISSSCRQFHYFMDMAYSPAVDNAENDFIGNRKGNMMPPENTVAYKYTPYRIDPADGELADKVLKAPPADLKGGEKQYNIFCAPCHGVTGKADGPISKAWKAIPIRPLVDTEKQAARAKDFGLGRLYHIITVGYGGMRSYAGQITEKDRWAIAHYVKELQKKAGAGN